MSIKDGPRTVGARRILTLGGVAVSLAMPAASAPVPPMQASKPAFSSKSGARADAQNARSDRLLRVAASGGGEGEGSAAVASDIEFLRQIGYLGGRLRVGLALFQAGDKAAAKAHMGSSIVEKVEPIEERLKDLGFDKLRADIQALSAATDADAPMPEIQRLYDAALTTADAAAAASPSDARDRLLALAELAKIAAADYAAAIEDDIISDVHEYQDAWGFMRRIKETAGLFTNAGKPGVAEAARKIEAQVDTTDPAFGDLQGKGIAQMDPGLLYAAAARMELAALGVK